MKELKGRKLMRAAYIREFIFNDFWAMCDYLKDLRGQWYILDKQDLPNGAIKVIVVSQYNDVPIWGK